MHPLTWEASGHIANFSDPMIDNKDSKKRYRVDHLIENWAEEKAWSFKTKKIQSLDDGSGLMNERIIIPDVSPFNQPSKDAEEAKSILVEMDKLLAKDDFVGLKKLID